MCGGLGATGGKSGLRVHGPYSLGSLDRSSGGRGGVGEGDGRQRAGWGLKLGTDSRIAPWLFQMR